MKRVKASEPVEVDELGRRADQADELRRAAAAAGLELGSPQEAGSLLALAEECARFPNQLANLVERCRSLPVLEYEQLRKRLAEAAGLSRVGVLDGIVRAPKDGEHAVVGLVTVEPCEIPVKVADLIDEVSAFLARFVHAPHHVHHAVALHILFGHSLDAFSIAPRLFITAPERECGKSLYLEVIAALSQRPLVASSVSDALLPRVIEKYRPTVLLDEVDTYKLNEREALAGVLNSGQRRNAAFAWKTQGDDHEPKPFSTWAPYVFAGIAGKMPDTTRSRCIIISLGRKPRTVKMEPFRRRQRKEAEAIASKLARFAIDNMDALRLLDERDDREDELPSLGSDRALDNWRPLLAVAELAGGEWPRRARMSAETLSGGDPEPEAEGAMLLADLQAVFFNEAGPGSSVRPPDEVPKAMFTSTILERLGSDDFQEHPWRDWRKGRPLDPAGLGKLLRPYNVRSGNIRVFGVQGKGYSLEVLGPVFDQYCPPSPVTARTSVPGASIPSEGGYDLGSRDPSHADSGTGEQPAPWDGLNGGTGTTSGCRPKNRSDIGSGDVGRPHPAPKSEVLL